LSAFLHVYGPFLQNGEFTSTSNAEFDESQRARNSDWGLRERIVCLTGLFSDFEDYRNSDAGAK